ncbi:phosphodiester glycosidase family protein [Streptomyces doebereineriae]|uniref:Phosphodiester glycosidase family protein n=1 Tax=Streptomyces doebereineriae TaxID=3075528 RepID=A0ABU2VJI4_9ACTN|nr:phosphodiester glycosidase family protein [Streptomyces sp. DSM 41640]MDT0485296.1 phosphodiester glycosidase family protein [Streptomyces sp. DSM 41640]
MNALVSELPSDEDQQAVTVLRALGYRVEDIQSLARNQRAFAIPVPERQITIAPGIRFHATAVELGEGCFTNAFTLRLDLEQAQVQAVTRPNGLHLRDLLAADAAVAAVSGSFSFISDDLSYQPAEPNLDFCCRTGQVTSLPTASKPAFLTHHGQAVIGILKASGKLRIQERPYRWVGSKEQSQPPHEPDVLTVFGAANCRVRYTDDPRTGFRRDVDSATNITPPDPTAVDFVVSWTPERGHRVTGVHLGGGADLFAENFVLRAARTQAEHGRLQSRVEITQVDGLDVHSLGGGLSLGPSVADAAAGPCPGYDQCLGTDPFRDTRHARTLIGLRGRELWFHVLDGAPLSDNFRGVTPAETAELCAREGLDPRHVYHLDGGASSKLAFISAGTTEVAGSMHYLRWPRSAGQLFRWQGLDGRVLRSAFAVSRRPGGTR